MASDDAPRASDDAAHGQAIVLDSSFLIAYHNAADVHHSAALSVMERVLRGEWKAVLLLEYVVLEVMTVLRMRVDAPTAVSVGELLLESREIQFLPCSDIFLRALETFRGERTAALSLVDAAIVSVARENEPGFVATFDGDFTGVDGVTMVPGPGA
jgi:predicted nucleic acid-binding protein